MGIPRQNREISPMENNATEQRLKAILQGAFAGPPTPLKDIPTRNGKPRKLDRKPSQRRRRQRKKRAA
jgi:hypothetical protein